MPVFLSFKSNPAPHGRMILGTIIMVAALALFWMAPAKAEGNCPPGFFPIGGGSAGWEGCAPMGPASGGNSSSSDSGPSHQITSVQRRPTELGFMAAAYHTDTGAYWVSIKVKTLEAAKARVLDACNKATGGGCHIAAQLGGMAQIYISEDGMGQRYIEGAVGNDMLLNPDVSVRSCLKNSFGCDFYTSYNADTFFLDVDPDIDQAQDFFPIIKLVQSKWAMVVQPTKPTAAHKKSWLISGSEDSEATVNKILDRCTADTGVSCTVSAYARTGQKTTDNGRVEMNGVLVHYVDLQGNNHWTSAVAAPIKRTKKKSPFGGFIPRPPDPETVKERVDRFCPSKCRIIATYDALTPRLQVIEDVP
jgi:hypothetical protein